MRRPDHASERGFSLLEMLVSTAVMVTVTAGVFSVMNPSQGSFNREPEVSDMQQRLRVSSDILYKDLVMAGAGAYQGAMSGSFLYYFAPILPYRSGSAQDDPPGSFFTNRISLMYVPTSTAQTSLATHGPSQTSAEIGVNNEPGCPPDPANSLCGFQTGMNVLIYDDSGAYDTFTITNVQPQAGHLQHNSTTLTYTNYQPNTTKIVEVKHSTYYVNTATSQLMYYDGGLGPDVPVIDNVVSVDFGYYGDPQPPQLIKPLSDPTGPWTTYGPKPPGLGLQGPATPGYAAGENCAFMLSGGLQVPRLQVLGAGSTLVKLDATNLTDGPWCPDQNNPNRWDADLLRIRKVVITVRVQAALASLRGPANVLFGGSQAFMNPGSATGSSKWIPDQEVRFQVTPRNLNLGR